MTAITSNFLVTYYFAGEPSREEKVRTGSPQEALQIAHERMPAEAISFDVEVRTRVGNYRRPMAAEPQKREQIS